MPRVVRNPYVAGTAINDPRNLFGRDDVLQLVETVLSESQNNVIVLFGQRRIGKTSILFNLQKRLQRPPFVTVYFDLMGRASDTMGQVLFELASKIAAELDIPPPAPDDFQENGQGFREKFLPRAYVALGEDRLIVLTDEFDVLDARSEESLSPFSAHKYLLRYVYDLITREPQLGFVFVVGRKTEDLSMHYRALFKTARYQRVSVLPHDATVDLIRQAERNNALRFDDEAVERIYALTSGHPYFTQLLCSLLFERAYAQSPGSTPVRVTAADVDSVTPQAFEAGEQIFEWIWDGLAPAERLIFSAVAADTGEQAVISDESLVSTLAANGVDMVSEQFELAPRKLVDWEMLRKTPGGYRFFIELMRRWVAEKKPLNRVRDEIDRINPLADGRYDIGRMLRQNGQLDEAVSELRNALNLNPNHFKARRMLAATYKDLNKLDDAVREWSEVYRRDQSSRENLYGYAGALLVRAEDYERADADKSDEALTQALADYDRVLQLLPSDRKARERKNAIWQARGQAALAAGDMDEALAAFERAEAAAQVAEVQAQKRRLELRALGERIVVMEQEERWDDAIAAYERLAQLDPTDAHWQQGLARAQQEQALARDYMAAKAAVAQHQWDTAQRLLLDVINVRPGYKDALSILNQVVHEKDELARSLALNEQAEKTLQSGDLSGTVVLYEKAGNITQAEEVRRALREREVQALQERVARLQPQAEAAEAGEQWSEAAAIYQDLQALQPDQPLWADQLRHSQIQADLQQKYVAGKLALDEGRVRDSRRLLGEVIAANPGYKDTTALLEQANIRQQRSDRRLVLGVLLITLFVCVAAAFVIIRGIGFGPTPAAPAATVDPGPPAPHELARYAGHHIAAYAAWSPNGAEIASVGNVPSIAIWDPATGVSRADSSAGYSSSVAWSPDGTKVATGNDNYNAVQVWAWDTTAITGQLLLELIELTGHTNTVRSVAWSPDGARLVSASDDHTVRVWDAIAGTEQLSITGHTGEVNSVAWSPDGSHIATASNDTTVRVWDPATGEERLKLEGHTGGVTSVAWSPDSTKIASASHDNTVRVWDATTGEEQLKLGEGNATFTGVAWSPDGKWLATASRDMTVRVWDATSGAERLKLTGHVDWVLSVAWSPDGTRLVSASDDNTVRVWEVVITSEYLKDTVPMNGVHSVALSPDGTRVAVASEDALVRVAVVEIGGTSVTGTQTLTLTGHTDEVLSIAWSPDSASIASASKDQTVRIWHADTGREHLKLEGHTTEVRSVTWSPSGQRIASAGGDGVVKVWDASTGDRLFSIGGDGSGVNSVAWSPDGKWLASGGSDKIVHKWDAANGDVYHTFEGHEDGITSVAWSPDSTKIASASYDNTVRVWDISSGEQVLKFEAHTDSVQSVAWSPDGKYIASAGDDDTVRVWDSASGEERLTLEGHTSGVLCVAWSPDGAWLVSASEDDTVRLWDVSSLSK